MNKNTRFMKMTQMFHIVDFSPWPVLVSSSLLTFFSSMVMLFNKGSLIRVVFSLMMMSFLCLIWWRDVVRESLLEGFHTISVQKSLKICMLLFIFSEVMFFMGFFWAFLHMSLSPSLELGLFWPPISIHPLNPFRVPFLNTLILLSSGVSVTWSHHSIMINKSGLVSLFSTVLLGFYFTWLQKMEYNEAMFSISDSVYGSVFYISTGFHGFHVLVGSCFLMVNLYRSLMQQFSSLHLIGLEMAIWYWHFVDVVWLFLFSLIYWWGF